MRQSGDSPAACPVIFTVDDEPEALSRVEGELRRRFGADYRIVCSDSDEDALATLDALLAEGAEVADDESLEAALEWLRESYWLKAPPHLRSVVEGD